MAHKCVFQDEVSSAIDIESIYTLVKSHPETSVVVRLQVVEHHKRTKHLLHVYLQLEDVFLLIVYIHLSFVVVGKDAVLAVCCQFHRLPTGIAVCHACRQGVVLHLLAVISVYTTLCTYPHSAIVSFYYRVDACA